MALIEVFHVAASELPVDANSSTDIPQGILVTLDSNGNVELADGESTTNLPIGVAADSRSSGVTSFTPESGSALSRNPKTSLTGALVIGSHGAAQRFTQNRVADNFNEVLASGKMTVYHSGGEFWTDQFEVVDHNGAVNDFVPATRLYASGASETAGSGEASIARAGRFTETATAAGTNIVVGYVLTSPTAYPSGVPGTEVASFSGLGGGEGGNSLTFGTFLHVKLAI